MLRNLSMAVQEAGQTDYLHEPLEFCWWPLLTILLSEPQAEPSPWESAG
jgi:hypothetical protein